MATRDDSALRALLQRATRPLPEVSWSEPEDLVRHSFEAMVDRVEGDVRTIGSSGSLCLHGAGVATHSAALAEVGEIISSWQRAVTAVGASLEDIHSARGRIPASVTQRTELALTAAPGAGSLVLRIHPTSDALEETAPNGQARLLESPRPLVDRAATELFDLLSIGSSGPGHVDDVARRLRTHGARVGSALRSLATALAESAVSFEVTWREPGSSTLRASWTPAEARWVKSFIEGRDLDTEEEIITGEAITVSSRERWLVDTEEGPEKVTVADLSPEAIRRVSPGDLVELRVETRTRAQPDGRLLTKRSAIALISVEAPGDES